MNQKIKILINKCLLPKDKPCLSRKVTEFEDLELITEPFLVFGTLQDLYKASLTDYSYNRYQHDYSVQAWAPVYKKYILNKEGYFKFSWQLTDDDIGKFIKSDSGKKILTGQVLDKPLLGLLQQNRIGVAPDDLLFLAKDQSKMIQHEFRFWCTAKDIIASSEYVWEEEWDLLPEVPKEAYQFVEKVISEIVAFHPFVIDVCSTPDGYKIVEFNNYFSSGFYKANIDDIIDGAINYLK